MFQPGSGFQKASSCSFGRFKNGLGSFGGSPARPAGSANEVSNAADRTRVIRTLRRWRQRRKRRPKEPLDHRWGNSPWTKVSRLATDLRGFSRDAAPELRIEESDFDGFGEQQLALNIWSFATVVDVFLMLFCSGTGIALSC